MKSAAYLVRVLFLREGCDAVLGAAAVSWAGRGAAALGLAGAVARQELAALLEGSNPRSGEPLSGLREGRGNAGFDLTWTAPKSVSLLLALGDEQLRRAVLEAHAAGVAGGLDYLERFECQARRGAAGCRIVAAHGFAGATYTGELSRAGDPHLHTHLVVANAVEGADGRWTAPDMRPVFAAAKTAGTLAQAVLRGALTDRLGVDWGEVRNGSGELLGVPAAALAHFSRRHAEIWQLAAARRAQTLQALAAAQRATRAHGGASAATS